MGISYELGIGGVLGQLEPSTAWMLWRVPIALAHHLLSEKNEHHKTVDFLFGKLNTAGMTLRTLQFFAPRQGLALNTIILLAIIINNWRES
ncbi:hypothetical protein R1T43_01965 [Alteromonas sp. CI.11.F.A3]|uniref:hypothetical protein n=1 Tax=Alteromonas sp. CI.11.F.A3 TaxID=3079555 RepID=UPI0029420609|nr:hypothetical protein [Alteromonas sp. CI.11.F.A3]WOI37833.1 hypothetical protein R1T43_01965 [Alteromonas sp. CI.11.F.A3]